MLVGTYHENQKNLPKVVWTCEKNNGDSGGKGRSNKK